MKQWIILILCLSLAITGCASATLPEATQEAGQITTEIGQVKETKPIETIPPMVYSKPLTAISMIPYSDAIRHQGGTALYSWSSQNIALVMSDHGVAQAITLDFANRDDRILNAAIQDLAAANTNYTGQSDWIPYFCDVRYTPTRLDQLTLSLAGYELLYDGTHRSGESAFALNYDMQTGIHLTLRDVLDSGYSADLLVELIAGALTDIADYLFEDYKDSISAMFATNAPIENWYFTNSGLCFFFNPYEIAPQSQGVVLAEVPYSQLTGILRDAYFPEEAVEFSGSLLMAEFEKAPVDQVSRYVEAVIDANGSQYLIYPQGTVQNIRVETGSWAKDGTFVADNTVFYAEALTENTALMMQIQPEHLGQLCITYSAGGIKTQTPWFAN